MEQKGKEKLTITRKILQEVGVHHQWKICFLLSYMKNKRKNNSKKKKRVRSPASPEMYVFLILRKIEKQLEIKSEAHPYWNKCF